MYITLAEIWMRCEGYLLSSPHPLYSPLITRWRLKASSQWRIIQPLCFCCCCSNVTWGSGGLLLVIKWGVSCHLYFTHSACLPACPGVVWCAVRCRVTQFAVYPQHDDHHSLLNGALGLSRQLIESRGGWRPIENIFEGGEWFPEWFNVVLLIGAN